ncbi:ubiquitin carboxyl-terminal hydrolase 15-like isoform X1 [Punica granatum]|uniref:ubiquitinyl hydrolase 1 n=1 Tax=Punica granatum TaxID=22663 RepID=A0A218X9F0_PUNGR|nr:ubiquitin carboxyl-terminal hydrolase 15-like isoform X1 [Punica granatum]XP_031373043.1 ubiquitin carboxyl-terminal hydrolase 15-like isoform X1 [Punica granatum]XP_031373124.1 ubiquitin carboxyl-terminal hydrolase 15-like isoform X1 [Punica granatum]OWM81022.1 hypothetical protein CDL15_Pgr007053 [Punica granatum]
MLEPREADIPILFLVLVVLPVVLYILLGKWSDAAKKKERVNLLAQLAAEEALRVETMAVAATVVPHVVPPKPKSSLHECAQCLSPATTRCSRCKSVRYCSGKCQIIHWRQVHQHECQPLDSNSEDSMDYQSHGCNFQEATVEKLPSENHLASYVSDEASQAHVPARRPREKRISRKCNREMLRKEDGVVSVGFEEARGNVGSTDNIMSPNACAQKEILTKHKIMQNKEARVLEEGTPRKSKVRNSSTYINGNATSVDAIHENHKCETQQDSSCSSSGTQKNIHQTPPPPYIKPDYGSSVQSGGAASGIKSGTRISKKQSGKASQEQGCIEVDKRAQAVEGSNAIANMGIMKMMGLRKSVKVVRQDAWELNGEGQKKTKMLFPYEEFVKFFQYEVFDLLPRGLINCGNSCYANAVLQCLTCTRPLTIYLLRRSHSRACCGKDWCLMCELEQHVTMLRETGAPLSPSRILSHMRSINRQIGDGSQEDAHEFLRLLVASMQSICLEGLGGERKVDPKLQETTFIQHTFGGRLRSRVKCLTCHHESERYENIMDLTLEIYGWVESLEDALTQFTTPEDLDGENMYRCGRCATYVQARKQLSVHEAPNILTIVLKRFQEGRYGKINKCITFPEMLDMIPYMTGTGDMPPLYLLYAVVVHLDTLNASFSGHYVCYVRNLQGSWYRIDDTEVQPVLMSQVMSEGAYILFYMRSSPRPHKAYLGKSERETDPGSLRHCALRSQKHSRPRQSKSSDHLVVPPEPFSHSTKLASNGVVRVTENGNIWPVVEKYSEFSDATSSDWSLFTSSDDASFTTESTRDSFSTADYSDNGNGDLISSIFSNLYGQDYSPRNTVSCRLFSNSGAQTRFASEEKGYVLDSYLSAQHNHRRRGLGTDRTSSHCKSTS